MNRPNPLAVKLSDDALQQALRALPAATPAADLDALNARVMGQWQERYGASGFAAAPQRSVWRKRLWVGTAGLAAMAALATVLLVNRPDPTLDELMQPDVLSQMAIGEM